MIIFGSSPQDAIAIQSMKKSLSCRFTKSLCLQLNSRSIELLIDDFDIAIGPSALSHDCHVLTANLKHFQRVHGLATSVWW